MEISKPFDRGWGKPHPECKKTMDEYEEIIDKNGVKTLKKKGEIDFYDEIQARGECVEIKDVIKRYKLNLKDIPTVEIDESINEMENMPTDWTEAQNVIARTKNTFGMLPKEERAIFNNNPEEFVKSIIEKNDKFKTLKTRMNPVNETMQSTSENKTAPGVSQTAAPGVSQTQTIPQAEVNANEQIIRN